MAADEDEMTWMIYYRQIMGVLETNTELRRAFQSIYYQMRLGANGARIGGLAAGPLGAVFGGAIGVAIGYFTVKDYNSMLNILLEMPDAEKERLAKSVQQAVGSATREALDKFLLNTPDLMTFFGIVEKSAFKQ